MCLALPASLDASRFHLKWPVEIDEFYVGTELKGRERDGWSRSRSLSMRGCGTFAEDKLPVSVLVDCGSGEQYVIPAKAATIYTDGFRAYEPLEEDDAFTPEYAVHGDGEYVDADVHVNTCESHASLA